LSENRAAAVRNYLVEKGIGTDRLKSTDLVKLNQLFQQNSHRKAENRRVEVSLIKE
jgi:outer membrane protein OmpA-like peptidoglycan-associated protein